MSYVNPKKAPEPKASEYNLIDISVTFQTIVTENVYKSMETEGLKCLY